MKSYLSLPTLLLLAACGGSGSGSSPATHLPTPPTTPPKVTVESDYYPLVNQLYLSYFGAAADYYGLRAFSAENLNNKLPLGAKELEAVLPNNPAAAKMVGNFADSQISTQFYSGSNEVVIDKVFSTLFRRAPDATEKAKWLAKLNGGEVSRRYLPLAILNSAAGGDEDILAKKAALAAAYVATSSAPPPTIELWQQEASRALLAAVESEADETLFTPLAKAAVRRFEAEAFAPPSPPPQGTVYGFSAFKFLPASVLMCATNARKSRLVDYLVSAKAVAISDAAGLAKQKFSIWHEDCVSISNDRSFAFDDGGNATLTIGTSIAKFTADQISQALKGQTITDPTFKRSVKLQAYSVARADGSKAYLLVERAVADGGTTEFLTAWILK